MAEVLAGLRADRESENPGIHWLDLVGDVVDEDDFARAAVDFFNIFGIDYTTTIETKTGEKLDGYVRQPAVIFEIVRRDRWSKSRFWVAMDKFKRRKNYAGADWYPEDFLSADTGKLYGYEWYLKQVHEDRTAGERIEHYRLHGHSLYRYASKPLPLPRH